MTALTSRRHPTISTFPAAVVLFITRVRRPAEASTSPTLAAIFRKAAAVVGFHKTVEQHAETSKLLYLLFSRRFKARHLSPDEFLMSPRSILTRPSPVFTGSKP
jgi:hypothetical protein